MRARLVFSAFVALIAAGCIRGRDTDLSTIKPRVVRWATAHDTPVTDWNRCTDTACFRYASLVMEGLTKTVVAHGSIETLPGLAESWSEARPSAVRFLLRKNARWSDGRPVTSSDFVASWTRLLRRCDDVPAASLLFAVRGARALCEGDVSAGALGLEAPSPGVLIVHLSRPDPLFARRTSHPALFPRRDDEPHAVTGPFFVDKAARGSVRRFLKNPHYHGASGVELDAIELLAIRSDATRAQLYLENGVDLADDVVESPGIPLPAEALLAAPAERVIALALGAHRRPLHSAPARRALSRAIDRAEMARLVPGRYLPAFGLLGAEGEAAAAKRAPTFAPEEALRAFSQLRIDWADGRWGEGPFMRASPKLVVAGMAGGAVEDAAMNLQAQFLKNLGARAEFLPKTKSALMAGFRSGPSAPGGPFLLTELEVDPFAPWRHLEGLLALPWESATSRREVEVLLKSAPAAVSLDSMNTLLARAETALLASEALVVPLLRKQHLALKHPRLSGVRRSALGTWELAEASVDN